MIYTHLIAAAVAALAAWFFQDNRYTAELAELRLEASEDKRKAVTTARNDERAITKTYQGALNAARTRETLFRTEIDHLRLVSDGLRDQSAEAARRLAAAPPAAVLEYATALSTVFNDCRAAYEEMVEKADGHASDVRTLTTAWPVIPPRPVAGKTKGNP